MNKSNLLISIITPTLNSNLTVENMLESVKNCEVNVDHVCIDGYSTDGTNEILQRYQAKIVNRQPDGVYQAMNQGVEVCLGDFLHFLNSDDFFANTKILNEVINVFKEHPDLDIVYTPVTIRDPRDITKTIRRLDPKYFHPRHLLLGLMPPHPGMFVRKTAFQKVGAYNHKLTIGADFDWMLRAHYIQKLNYRYHDTESVAMRPGGISSAGISSYARITFDLQKAALGLGLWTAVLMIPFRALFKIRGCSAKYILDKIMNRL